MTFRAFDTETINRPEHGEACLLIKMGERGPEFLEFPKTFKAIWKFLAGGKCVCWNMDFDARAIVHYRFLPYRVVERLGLFGRAKYKSWGFRYVPGKMLEVRGFQKSFILYDLQQFFGASLASASAAHLGDGDGEGKKHIPSAWYGEMDRCLADARRPRVLEYARRDVEVTQGLCDRFLQSLSGVGLKPARLSSCATLARLKWGRVMERVHPPGYLNRIFQRGFFGGRIETRVLGRIGPCKLYDIHSAYPSVLATLKDPRGRVVQSGPEWKYKGADYGVYRLSAEIPTSRTWGPLAFRHGAKVIYPTGIVETTCGVPAIEALRREAIRFSVREATEIFCSGGPIFDGVAELFAARKDTVLGLAAKNTMNAAYGVLAETRNYTLESDGFGEDAGAYKILRREIFGKATNFILASHITETIRMKLWEIMDNEPGKIIFAATDGLLCSGPLDIPLSDSMGAWGFPKSFSGGVVLGCGRYFLEGDYSIFHLRGFPVKAQIFDKLRRTKRRYAYIPDLQTPSLRQWASSFVGSLNVLEPAWRRFEINDDKRVWSGTFPRICDAWENTLTSEPYIMGSPEKLGALWKSPYMA